MAAVPVRLKIGRSGFQEILSGPRDTAMLLRRSVIRLRITTRLPMQQSQQHNHQQGAHRRAVKRPLRWAMVASRGGFTVHRARELISESST